MANNTISVESIVYPNATFTVGFTSEADGVISVHTYQNIKSGKILV